MNRKRITFDDHKHYFKDVDFITPDLENYNSNKYVKIKCPNGHIYSISVNMIKNRHKDPTICPHCNPSSTKNNFTEGIPFKEIFDYCNKFNFKFYPQQEYYSRWTDQITFICQNDDNEIKIKSLNNFEKNYLKKNRKISCEVCIEKYRNEIKELKNKKFDLLYFK
ncbi:MAG: hypothetical protein ACOC80_15295, partial [Petrotogales bacterium]